MHNYQLRAFKPDGAFVFGATLKASDDQDAIGRVRQMDLAAYAWELRRGQRLVRGGQPQSRTTERRSA